MNKYDINDATNVSFAKNQAEHIEAEVFKKPYPDITYQADIPVDTTAGPFAKSVSFYSSDMIGEARLMNGKSDDVPLANASMAKHSFDVHMAGIGYSFSLEEIGQAQMAGVNLDMMGADSARYAYEKFVDNVAYEGNAEMGVKGLYNHGDPTTVAAGAVWSGRTADQILTDINSLISGNFVGSFGIEMPNVLKLPLTVFSLLASKRVTDTAITVLDFVKRANVFTAKTGQALMISGDYRLTTKAVAYHKDPRVLKLHIPMPMRFLPLQPRGLGYDVPGMFRLAGLDIRRKGAIRYMSGVADS